MQIWVIEDEKPAAARLVRMLKEIEPGIDIRFILHSVQVSISHFLEEEPPQLLFMDIELTVGLSFQIFDQIQIPCPIIFTTAYDDYWQQALKHYGLDYLLKPVKKEELIRAFEKYHRLQNHFIGSLERFIAQYQKPVEERYRKRILTKLGNEYVSLTVEEIAYFFAEQKMVCLITNDGRKYLMDQSLSDLENEFDPEHFYRLNRKYLVHRKAISRVKAWGRGKLLIDLFPDPGDDVSVSQELAGKFKAWLDN